MAARDALWRDHQRTRWLRPDAHRWIKPDAQRFLRPGVSIAAVFPAFEAKYSPDQPRVPAGSSEGGQWTRGEEEGGDIAFDELDFNLEALFENLFDGLPDSSLDLSDIFTFLIDGDSDSADDFTFVAGSEPDVATPDDAAPQIHLVSDTNGNGNGENLEPLPKIPEQRPEDSKDRTSVFKELGRWFGRNVGRATGVAGVLDGLAEQFDYIGKNVEAIKSYADPPKALEELKARASSESERGYQDHHIVERSAKKLGILNERILSPENTVRIPVLKHYEITAYYNSSNVLLPDGSYGSPREYLRDKDFDARHEFGLEVLRRHGVLK